MDWLFKEDDYIPESHKEVFIDKTISGTLKVLAKIRRADSKRGTGFIYKINPALKLTGFLAVIILLSLSKSIVFAGAIDMIALFFVLLSGKNRSKAAFSGSAASMFTFIMLVPSILAGNVTNSIAIVMKVFGDITLLNVLSSSTRWSDITKSLRLLHIPDIFIFAVDIAIIYIFLLGEISLDMLYALKTRSIGKFNKKYASVSGITGSLFIKSKDMAEEMYSAMECRGFTGEYKAVMDYKFNFYDFLFAAFFAAIIVLYFLFEGVV